MTDSNLNRKKIKFNVQKSSLNLARTTISTAKIGKPVNRVNEKKEKRFSREKLRLNC